MIPTINEIQRLINSIIRPYAKMLREVRVSEDDVRQESWLVIENVKKSYDPSKGAFSTYAYMPVSMKVKRMIHNAIRRNLPQLGFEQNVIDRRSKPKGYIYEMAREEIEENAWLKAKYVYGLLGTEIGILIGSTSANVHQHTKKAEANFRELVIKELSHATDS